MRFWQDPSYTRIHLKGLLWTASHTQKQDTSICFANSPLYLGIYFYFFVAHLWIEVHFLYWLWNKVTLSIDTCLQRLKVPRKQFCISILVCNVWRSLVNSFVYWYLLALFEGPAETVLYIDTKACLQYLKVPRKQFCLLILACPAETVLSINACLQRLKAPWKQFCILILACNVWRSRGNSFVCLYFLATFEGPAETVLAS